jgi:hypothetical protein
MPSGTLEVVDADADVRDALDHRAASLMFRSSGSWDDWLCYTDGACKGRTWRRRRMGLPSSSSERAAHRGSERRSATQAKGPWSTAPVAEALERLAGGRQP